MTPLDEVEELKGIFGKMAEHGKQGVFTVCRLDMLQMGRTTLVDAVAPVSGEAGLVRMFFTHDTPGAAVSVAPGLNATVLATIGDSPVIGVEAGDRIGMVLDGQPVSVAPHSAEPDFFAGRNVALALRNGESADQVLDWLQFHLKYHAMTGALIISRSKPGTDEKFAKALKKGVKALSGDLHVMLVEADRPLGDPKLPPEAHPFCVSEAPGKDRMEIPPADPWASPFIETVLYEWARARFLSRARAVANIDVCDLMASQSGPDAFDQAVAADSGYVQLSGRHCFPWRVRSGQAPEFGDHLCVQFDSTDRRRRWCVAPEKLPEDAVLRTVRVGGVKPDPVWMQPFWRCMAILHPTESVSQIVPKTSLIENADLMQLMEEAFDANPVRMPEEALAPEHNGRRAIVTTMKNEGPFILEWIAYHRAIGVDDFLVFTNDCTDGTDEILDLLQARGVLQHRDNPFRETNLKPQHAALQAAEKEPLITDAEWAICMDVDEYINVKCGDGTLDALFAALDRDVNMISLTWRLFGNDDVHEFDPGFITGQFLRSAPEFIRKPHQAWGFKTLFRNVGLFKKMGVHRPKGLKPQLWDQIRWVNGSGQPMPREMYRNAWRSTTTTYGYDLVQLNHYAVRSAESFLVKRDRGRVNHVDRDQGLAYWFRMNNNGEEETSITRMLPKLQEEFDRLMAWPEIAAAHEAAVAAHRAKIAELKSTPNYSAFYEELTSPRMEKLSRLHAHFGSAVFLQGPAEIPDEIVEKDPAEEFFFTVEETGETAH